MVIALQSLNNFSNHLFRFDSYTLQARLFPTLITFLPVGLAIIAWFPNTHVGWGIIFGLITSSGITILLSHIGRDLGKKKESTLFMIWGGKPTIRMLRHNDKIIDKITLSRYHKKLQNLIQDIHIPNSEEENDNPDLADEVYESCIKYLLEKTRNRHKFPLVYKENVNYGFRRNLWGMKPAGVFLSTLCAICSIASIYVNLNDSIQVSAILATIINIILLVWWIFRINHFWVYVAAKSYAERIISSRDIL